MKSINGFNNSSLQGSSNLSALNSIGAGVDIAKTAMSNDVHFQTSTGGTSYSLPQQVYDFGTAGTHCPFELYLSTREYKGPFGDQPPTQVRCIKVWPGTVNNIVPIWIPYDDTPLDEIPAPFFPKVEGGFDPGGLPVNGVYKYYFYLIVYGGGSSPEEYFFPTGNVEFVASTSPAPSSNDDTAYLTIGVVQNSYVPDSDPPQYTLTISNMTACGSKWVERLKCGTSTAEYYWGVV
jgi:hypothetical protein